MTDTSRPTRDQRGICQRSGGWQTSGSVDTYTARLNSWFLCAAVFIVNVENILRRGLERAHVHHQVKKFKYAEAAAMIERRKYRATAP